MSLEAPLLTHPDRSPTPVPSPMASANWPMAMPAARKSQQHRRLPLTDVLLLGLRTVDAQRSVGLPSKRIAAVSRLYAEPPLMQRACCLAEMYPVRKRQISRTHEWHEISRNCLKFPRFSALDQLFSLLARIHNIETCAHTPTPASRPRRATSPAGAPYQHTSKCWPVSLSHAPLSPRLTIGAIETA